MEVENQVINVRRSTCITHFPSYKEALQIHHCEAAMDAEMEALNAQMTLGI